VAGRSGSSAAAGNAVADALGSSTVLASIMRSRAEILAASSAGLAGLLLTPLLPGLLQGGAPAELLLRLTPLLFAGLLAYRSRRIDVGLIGGLSLYGLMVMLL